MKNSGPTGRKHQLPSARRVRMRDGEKRGSTMSPGLINITSLRGPQLPLKGIVPPKMKIMSLYTHPHSKPVRPSFIFQVLKQNRSWAWTFFRGRGGVGQHAMTVTALTFERILWQSYCFPYSNCFFFSWIYGWPEEWNLYHTLGKLWAISPLINTRGVTIHLAHKMRQNTDTWFTRTRQYFNTIFKKFSMTKYLSFNYKK